MKYTLIATVLTLLLLLSSCQSNELVKEQESLAFTKEETMCITKEDYSELLVKYKSSLSDNVLTEIRSRYNSSALDVGNNEKELVYLVNENDNISCLVYNKSLATYELTTVTTKKGEIVTYNTKTLYEV